MNYPDSYSGPNPPHGQGQWIVLPLINSRTGSFLHSLTGIISSITQAPPLILYASPVPNQFLDSSFNNNPHHYHLFYKELSVFIVATFSLSFFLEIFQTGPHAHNSTKTAVARFTDNFHAAEPKVLSQSALSDTVGHAFLLEAVSPLSPQFSTSPASPSCEYAPSQRPLLYKVLLHIPDL